MVLSLQLPQLLRMARSAVPSKIENHANNLSGSALYLFCQQNDGKWKAVSAVSGGK
jgi:hypothetical protein